MNSKYIRLITATVIFSMGSMIAEPVKRTRATKKSSFVRRHATEFVAMGLGIGSVLFLMHYTGKITAKDYEDAWNFTLSKATEGTDKTLRLIKSTYDKVYRELSNKAPMVAKDGIKGLSESKIGKAVSETFEEQKEEFEKRKKEIEKGMREALKRPL